MTQIDDSEFYYKISFRQYGYSAQYLMNVYRRRKFLWFNYHEAIDKNILIGPKYGRDNPEWHAQSVVAEYLEKNKKPYVTGKYFKITV